MRIEQPQFFVYGMLLFMCAWAFTKTISSAKLKLHIRAISLAFGLGFIVVPGHGEFIVGPVLACLFCSTSALTLNRSWWYFLFYLVGSFVWLP